MTAPARDLEPELTAAIDRGDPGSWLVYTDWCELQGGYPTVHPALAPDVPLNGAAPIPHAELFEGIWLYERLTNIIPWVCHGPTNTSWVWAYRGLWNTTEVIVFRPGDDAAWHENVIAEDIGGRAIRPRADWPPSTWAMIAAPPGVRLRAVAMALAAQDEALDDAAIFHIVAQTEGAGPEDVVGDTFVGWDGSLWFCPTFPRCWQLEMPSWIGGNVRDALVLDNHFRLREMLAGLPRRGEHLLETFASFEGGPHHAALPASTGPQVRALLDEFRGPYRPGARDWFLARCRVLARASLSATRELRAILRATFPTVYDRQRAALRAAGIDIDQPWAQRRGTAFAR